MLILALNLKTVPKTMVNDTWGGVNHILMLMLALNFKIVPEILVSDTWGSISF